MPTLPELQNSDHKYKRFLSTAMMISGTIPDSKYFSKPSTRKCGTPNLLRGLYEDNVDGVARYRMDHQWHPLHSAMYGVTHIGLNNYILRTRYG